MNTTTLRHYAPVVLRIALAMVMLWFGSQQYLNTGAWLAYVPASVVSLTGLSATALVYLNGALELVLGIALLVGWGTRWVALILMLHLLDIAYIVGYGEIAVRDFGLAMGLLSVAMHGADALSIDRY